MPNVASVGRVARLTLSMEGTGAPWEFGGNGLRTRTDRR